MKKYDTYFFDIDGTIFKYRQFESYEGSPPELTPGALEKLQEIASYGHTIVLTTARPEYMREHTIHELGLKSIPFDQLIMGIGRGIRHLINDMSSTTPGNRAIAWNVERDAGLQDIVVVP